MRRSFGGNHGGSGGGSGGGNMLRTLARTVSRTSAAAGNTTIQEPFNSSSSSSLNKSIKTPTSPTVTKSRNNHLLSLSSPPSSSHFSPFVTSPTGHHHRSWRSPSSSVCDDFEWICADDGFEDASSFDDFVLGPAPSRHEAQSAVTALQQVIETAPFSHFVRDKYGTNMETDVSGRAVSPTRFNRRTACSISESDWAEPSLQLCNAGMLQRCGSGTVYDAFHLLQTDPSVQRMVISLSSDPAVWNAVLNNEVVQELRQSISPGDNNSIASLETDFEDSEAAASILKWILDNTKAKVMEIIEMINKLVNDLFQPLEGHDKPSTTSADQFEEKLRYSLMLTVVVLLIVAVARGKRA
ncbi:hypothetical protein QQ045_012068 [Rhodiola kirilowii]